MRRLILFLLGSVLFGATPTMATVLIGPVTNPANGHIYYLLEEDFWTNSEAEAVALGGHLASVNDAPENTFLVDTFGEPAGANRDLWIGLNDVAVEGTFVWSSGEPVTFTNWFPGQPDGQPGADYGHITKPGIAGPGKWDDTINDNPALGIFGVVELEAAFCGNGFVEPGEECDDGNDVSGDGCEPDCTETIAVPMARGPALAALALLLVLALTMLTLVPRLRVRRS